MPFPCSLKLYKCWRSSDDNLAEQRELWQGDILLSIGASLYILEWSLGDSLTFSQIDCIISSCSHSPECLQQLLPTLVFCQGVLWLSLSDRDKLEVPGHLTLSVLVSIMIAVWINLMKKPFLVVNWNVTNLPPPANVGIVPVVGVPADEGQLLALPHAVLPKHGVRLVLTSTLLC